MSRCAPDKMGIFADKIDLRQDGHLCSLPLCTESGEGRARSPRMRAGGVSCVMRVLSEAGSGYLASVVISGAEEEEGEDGRKEKEGYRRKGHMH